jgi:hypothetical protein
LDRNRKENLKRTRPFSAVLADSFGRQLIQHMSVLVPIWGVERTRLVVGIPYGSSFSIRRSSSSVEVRMTLRRKGVAAGQMVAFLNRRAI